MRTIRNSKGIAIAVIPKNSGEKTPLSNLNLKNIIKVLGQLTKKKAKKT